MLRRKPWFFVQYSHDYLAFCIIWHTQQTNSFHFLSFHIYVLRSKLLYSACHQNHQFARFTFYYQMKKLLRELKCLESLKYSIKRKLQFLHLPEPVPHDTNFRCVILIFSTECSALTNVCIVFGLVKASWPTCFEQIQLCIIPLRARFIQDFPHLACTQRF